MKKPMFSAGLAVILGTAGLAPAPAIADTPMGEVVQGRRVSGPRSIQLTPEQLGAEMQKGQLDENALAALRAGQYASAEDNARQCIELGQDSGLAQEILAFSLYAQGKSQAALQAYKQIADAGGKSPRNMIPYALLLLKSGQWAKAATVYNQARNGVGDDSLPQLEGPFSIETPQPKELESAIHIAQGLAGSTLGSPALVEDPMTQFGDALRLAPDSPLANYYYGYGWQKLYPAERAKLAAKPGQREAVKAALEKAARLGAPDVSAAAQAELKQLR